MSKAMYYVFFPALVFTSLGTSVTGSTLLSWWPLPVNTALNVILGMLLGAGTFHFVGLPDHLWPHFVSCAGVGAATFPVTESHTPEAAAVS
jgi:predicted permease